MEEPTALWVRLLKGLYFPNGDFLDALRGGRASWGWSSLLIGRDVLKRQGLWTIGNGENIRVFSDPWVTLKLGYRAEARSDMKNPTESRVSMLMRDDGTWDEVKVRQTVIEEDAELILAMPIPIVATQDKHIWPHSKEGKTQARSVYHRMREPNKGGEPKQHQ